MRGTGNEIQQAALFPGQGSQQSGMAELIARVRPEMLEAARSESGDDPVARVEEDTRYAQLAIFCTSVAAWELIEAPRPTVLAGHSLGEIAALVAAGALDWRDGVRLVAARGRLMSEAAERDPGAMVVLKAEIGRVEELAERVEVTVANHNAPDQVVVAGPEARIARLEAEAADAGIACRRLRVKGAFHTPALAETAERFAEILAGVDFEPTSSVVYSCVTARPFTDPGRELAAALISRVRWLETLRAIRDSGIASFVDVGPGRVMAGLVRRCLDEVEVDTNPGLRAEAAR